MSEEVKNKPVILVAEDTDSNYLLVSVILKGYRLYRANDGVEAVEKCKELNPDLILMDIRMPRMDGIEATKKIRSFSTDVPIIAVTAHAFELDRQMALEAGCNDFLTKPISLPDLKAMVQRWT